MKNLVTGLLCAFFLSNSTNASTQTQPNDPTVKIFNKKWGAGPNGLIVKHSIPAEGRRTPRWFRTYYIPAVTLNSTMNITYEFMQRLFMPNFTLNGAFATPTTPKEHLASAALGQINQMFSASEQAAKAKLTKKLQAQQTKGEEATFVDPDLALHELYTPPKESHQFAHFFTAQNDIQNAQAILIVPGSKKARLTEISRAKTLSQKGYAVLVMDQLTKEHPEEGHSKSTVSNQLNLSLDAASFNIQLAHLWLQQKGYTQIAWDCSSVGSLYAQHALDPELLRKMPEGYIQPAHIHFNDCPQTLVPLSFEGNLLKEIPLTVSVATQDTYTSKGHAEMFLAHLQGNGLPLSNVTFVEHSGYHDQSTRLDSANREYEPYYLADATVYDATMASMPSLGDAVDQALIDIIQEQTLTENNDYNALFNPLMGKLSAIETPGNIFRDPRIYIQKASIMRIQERLIKEKSTIEYYRGSLTGMLPELYENAEHLYILRFKELFEIPKGEQSSSSKNLARDIGLPASDVFVENQQVLTQYVLRSEEFNTQYKHFRDMTLQTQEEERRAGLKGLLELIQLRVSDTKTSIQLAKKVKGLLESANISKQITAFESNELFEQPLTDPVEEGRWIPIQSIPKFLSLLPKGAIFGAQSKQEFLENETDLEGRIRGGMTTATPTIAPEEDLPL